MSEIPKRVMAKRCPSHYPGGDVQCERDFDGHTNCMARRRENSIMAPGELVSWNFSEGTFPTWTR